MKSVFAIVIGLFLIFTSQAWACGGGCGGSCRSCGSGSSCGAQDSCSEKLTQNSAGQAVGQKSEAKPVEVQNKICPVEGVRIGNMGEAFKVVYEDKIYNLCCQGCEGQFKKDPQKYIGMVEKEISQK